jgi:transposase
MTLISAKNELARCVYNLDRRTGRRGRPRVLSTTEAINKIVYVCRTGCQWSALEGVDGVSYKTVYHRFNSWSKHRIFEHVFYRLVAEYRATRLNPLAVDTNSVKNVYGHNVKGRNYADRGRMSTKVSILSDSNAVPLALAFHEGNRNDANTLSHLLNEAQRKALSPLGGHSVIYADKGYDSETCRKACISHGLQPYIPRRGSPAVWGGIRIAVEIAIGRIDKFRRVILRYDSHIRNFKSFHYLACACIVP